MLRLARGTKDDRNKVLLLELAQSWIGLASKLDNKEGHGWRGGNNLLNRISIN